jgi:hypothetical protein
VETKNKGERKQAKQKDLPYLSVERKTKNDPTFLLVRKSSLFDLIRQDPITNAEMRTANASS